MMHEKDQSENQRLIWLSHEQRVVFVLAETKICGSHTLICNVFCLLSFAFAWDYESNRQRPQYVIISPKPKPLFIPFCLL